MADARDEGIWTRHAAEHKDISKVHGINDGFSLRKKLLELKDEQEVVKVLDLGCGSGLWRNLFEGFDYTGADQNEAMIRVAKARLPEDKFLVSNGMDLVFDDSSFDAVFTAAVIQHNQNPDKVCILAELRRILRPGGFYICTENTFREDNYKLVFGDVPYVDNLTDGYSYTPNGWKKFMSENGFEMIWFEKPSEYVYKRVD